MNQIKPLLFFTCLTLLFESLCRWQRSIPALPMREAVAATVHLFIFNPLNGKSLAKLFRVHPFVEDRVARLKILPGQRAFTVAA